MTGPIRAAPLQLEPGQFLTSDGILARRVPAGTAWFRLHRTERAPIHFGRADPGLRFNDPGVGTSHSLAPTVAGGAAPDSGGYRICYLGFSPEAAFVVVFFRRLPTVSVAWSEPASRSMVEVHLAHEVTLVCLSGPGLLRLGVSAEIVAGRDYAPAQVVARGLWRHLEHFDGIEYPTRHDTDQRSVALFDRAATALPPTAVAASTVLEPTGQLVAEWIRRYRFPVIDDR